MSNLSDLDEYLDRYDEACAKMRDPEHYDSLRRLTFEERHECPVEDCSLSAEEHHRLAYGVLSEVRSLRRRLEMLEHQIGSPTTD